jgi:hypothetical protein
MEKTDFPITPEEAELLSQEKDLLTKQEEGETLEANETEALKKISTLKEDVLKRIQEKNTPENQKKLLQSALEQKTHFREKYEEAQKAIEELQKGAPKDKKVETEGVNVDPLEIVKLSKVLKDYNEEEVEFILTNSKDKSPEAILKTLENEYVQAGIEKMREKVAEKDKVPAPTSPKSVITKGKTADEIADMPKDDHKKLFEEDLKRREGGGAGV